MASIVFDYERFEDIAAELSDLISSLNTYQQDMQTNAINKFANIEGGTSVYLDTAEEYLIEKKNELSAKAATYQDLATQFATLLNHAQVTDDGVVTILLNNQTDFYEDYQHLVSTEDWSWLAELRADCEWFDWICNQLSKIDTAISDLFADIEYWWNCEGGKEIALVVLAVIGTIAAIVIFIASFPLSTIVAIFECIGAAIAVINAFANLGTSIAAAISISNGDPTWAKIYGGQDKLSDVLRQWNTGSGGWNRVINIAAGLIDTAEIVCDVVTLGASIKDIGNNFNKTKDKIKHLFNKDTGPISYFKEYKYKEVLDYNIWGKPTGTKWVLDADANSVVKTQFTWNSIKNGMNHYNINLQGFKDTLRYNLKYNDMTGSFAEGIAWEHRKDFLKGFGKSIERSKNTVESLVLGEFDATKEISTRVFESSKMGKIVKKTGIPKLVGETIGFDHMPSGVYQKIENFSENTIKNPAGAVI